MKVHYDIQEGAVKGLDLRLSPIEGLTLHSALMQYAHELSNNEVDRMTAMKMCDNYLDAMYKQWKEGEL